MFNLDTLDQENVLPETPIDNDGIRKHLPGNGRPILVGQIGIDK